MFVHHGKMSAAPWPHESLQSCSKTTLLLEPWNVIFQLDRRGLESFDADGNRISGANSDGHLVSASQTSNILRSYGESLAPDARRYRSALQGIVFWCLREAPGSTYEGSRTPELKPFFVAIATSVPWRPVITSRHRSIPWPIVFHARSPSRCSSPTPALIHF